VGAKGPNFLQKGPNPRPGGSMTFSPIRYLPLSPRAPRESGWGMREAECRRAPADK